MVVVNQTLGFIDCFPPFLLPSPVTQLGVLPIKEVQESSQFQVFPPIEESRASIRPKARDRGRIDILKESKSHEPIFENQSRPSHDEGFPVQSANLRGNRKNPVVLKVGNGFNKKVRVNIGVIIYEDDDISTTFLNAEIVPLTEPEILLKGDQPHLRKISLNKGYTAIPAPIVDGQDFPLALIMG
jgi:hypothetical protein